MPIDKYDGGVHDLDYYLHYWFDNLTQGETSNTNKRVDAEQIKKVLVDIFEHVSHCNIHGPYCVDGNSQGNSVVATAKITVKNKNAHLGIVENNDYIFLTDGTNYWSFQNTVADDELTFDDTDLSSGAGPADYSNAAWLDSLRGFSVGFLAKYGKSSLNLVETHADGFTADDLSLSAADATKVNTLVEDHKDKLDDIALADGADWVIANATVKKAALVKAEDDDAVFIDDSPRNLSRGMFDNALYRTDMLFGLQETPAPANDYAVETTIVKSGDVSQFIDTNGGQQGIEIQLDPLVDQSLLADKKMTLVVWIYSTVANKLAIGFYDDVDGYQVTNQTYAKDGWVKLSVTKTIGTGAVTVRGVVRSVDGVATNHYVDIAGIYIGETAFDPIAPSVSASIVNNALDNRFYNYIPMGDLDSQIGANDYPGGAWLNGDAEEPCFWFGTGVTVRETTEFMSANASWDMELDAGEYFEHYISCSATITTPVQECLGKPGTFACWIKKNGANTEDLDLEIITNGTGGTTTPGSFAVNDYTDWAQIAITLDNVPSDATYIRLRVINNGANQINVYVDQFMYTQTEYPIAFTTLTPWNYEKKILTYAGSQPNAATKMNAQGGMVIGIPIGLNMLIYGMTIFQGTAAAGSDLYYPYTSQWSGAAWVDTDRNGALAVTLGNAEDYESACISSGAGGGLVITSGSLIGAKVDGDPVTPGSDAYLILHHLTWGV